MLLINTDDKLHSNNQIITNTFNNYFTTLPDKVSVNTSKQLNKTPNVTDSINYIHEVFKQPFPNIKVTPISTKEMKAVIKSIQWNNSQGYDEIPLKTLKIIMPCTISPLTYVCNKVLFSSVFPVHLKYSQISPIFKKGDETEMSNYRPISLLTPFSKFFERAINSRLQFHMHSNNILAQEQCCFGTNSSTELATYNLTNNSLAALDNKLLA